ncbi:hypothetical protein AAE026_11050 [Bradyrhizobium sp. DN5]
MFEMSLLQWDTDQPEILRRLQNRAKLKICCKTLSEPEFVQSWINHHSAIVGPQNLIIADNGSSDAATLDVYRRAAPDVTIFRFSGAHNDIHWHPRFRPLFDRLRETVEFFSFVDVDERLVWIDRERWFADERVLDCLKERGAIYPATWLINAIGRVNHFTLLDTERRRNFSNNLKWGKPILPPELIAAQSGIHNIQYAGSRFSVSCGSNLFLLHLTQFPDQRIAANVRKLANRNLIDHAIDPEAISRMDFSRHPDPTVLRFQKEVAEMIAYLKGDKSIPNSETEVIELGRGGTVVFSNADARGIFSKFIEEGPSIIVEMFK